ncbi:hypothetical protein EDC30_104352 [Paucimonas lemoignei]|uniref:Uncharacterized protein n=1 Tax=Paucimonas lemoignei TaxID=29443 RepID=A0A4R3HWN4_PAULE|nr:hypothetical protein [Paucimonas lemoignei]TCS37548.1 hypothetical protein EDC30_104352 [Paucimonas lemoignei]
MTAIPTIIAARFVRRLGVVAACALASANAVSAELDCPFFAEPRARVQWVAQHMVYNGVPMSIKRFDSEQKPEAILAFYRQAWGNGAPATAPQEYMSGPWQTIAVVRGKCFFTVQVQAAGTGSTGLLSATQAPESARLVPDDKKLPMMSGSTVLNDIDHHDDGKAARTLLLSNGFSAEANADFYRQQLGGQGWKVISSYQMKTKKGPGITLVMKRGLAEASLVFTREGTQTMVLANLVDKP